MTSGQLTRQVFTLAASYAGSLMPGRVLDFAPNRAWHRVVNLNEVAGVLAFDKWLSNSDRRQAVYAKQDRSSKLKAYWIDHGNCFGEESWNLDNVCTAKSLTGNPVFTSLREWSEFEPWISRIEAFPVQSLREVFYATPTSWREGDDFAFESLVAQLSIRQKRIRTLLLDVIYSKKPYFPPGQITIVRITTPAAYTPAQSTATPMPRTVHRTPRMRRVDDERVIPSRRMVV